MHSPGLLWSRRGQAGVTASRHPLTRAAAIWLLGIAGLLVYNWWVLVPLKPGLMRSPSELFSNLEATGQPFATVMQRADLISGLLLLSAFLVAGSGSVPGARREWLGLMTFGAAVAAGGIFPETCADGINATCRTMELTFRLPADQYLHIVAGIFEFGGITAALLFAARRTRGEHTRSARVYRRLTLAAYVAYPLLGVIYAVNRLGGIMEALFFVGFTAIAATQLCERARAAPVRSLRAQRASGLS
jgi:hypothetical protein